MRMDAQVGIVHAYNALTVDDVLDQTGKAKACSQARSFSKIESLDIGESF